MHSKPFNILIADDNPDNIHLLERRLRKDNYIFHTAMNGQETLEQVERISPDLILLDVNMPIMGGFEVCRRLRDNDATRAIPVIIITAAKTSIEDQITGLGLGADDYITKPFNPRDLALRVERKLQVKALEDELRRQKEEMSAIVFSAADAILRVGADNHIQFCNPAAQRLFNCANPPVGQHYDDICKHCPALELGFQQIKPDANSQISGYEVEMDNGKTIFVNVAAVGVPGKQYNGWVLILHDISHLKEIDRLKSNIIANAAHDLKNPLSSAILYTELLVESITDHNSDQYTLATSALHSIERMKQMTLHLLDLERLENGNILDITACDLVEIGQSLVQQMSGLAQKQNIHLTASLPDTPVMVEGDFVYLSRAVANLMSNALKFTPAGGTVTVSLKQKDQAAIISVQDTGPGIPPNHQARIFNRFYRVKDQKETREKIGSGLGLSIVKSIVTQHQGTIWLESKEGVGTTFHISLPVLKP